MKGMGPAVSLVTLAPHALPDPMAAAVPEVAASDALPVHFAGVPMTSRSPKSVTESAFVQSPTHPPRKVPSWSRKSASFR